MRGASVGTAALLIGPVDLLQNDLVIDRTLTRWPAAPCVTARAHPIQFTHPHDFVFFLVEVDEGEDVRFRMEVNAIAFFKRSCSFCRRA
jgi:hypothetical protein